MEHRSHEENMDILLEKAYKLKAGMSTENAKKLSGGDPIGTHILKSHFGLYNPN